MNLHSDKVYLLSKYNVFKSREVRAYLKKKRENKTRKCFERSKMSVWGMSLEIKKKKKHTKQL